MRRGIEIREAFAPTRLSGAHLRTAYEVVTPVIERPVVAAKPVVVEERVARPRRRGAGVNR